MVKTNRKVVVMGLGYIGLPTASMLATIGHRVTGVDINKDVVDTINMGNIHIVEPDLDVLVSSAVQSGRLKASLIPEVADVFIVAVPTPFKFNDNYSKTPDIHYVEEATQTICPYLKVGDLIVLESTSPIGTTERVKEIIFELRSDLFIKAPEGSDEPLLYIAHCPERVLPGHILRELVDNDRVIGGINKISAEKAMVFYKTFCNGDIFLTDSRTAEMTKLVENSFRDVNIAFANELSTISDKLNINVWELIELANKHPRVNILQPGPGVGGHCIAVDPWFIVAADPEGARLIKTAREVNDDKPSWVLKKIQEKVCHLSDPVIGCLGLAFKANIDDLRESPALEIVKTLLSMNIGTVLLCEPNLDSSYNELPLHSLKYVLEKSDIIVVLVDHTEFKQVDHKMLQDKILIDTRGIFSVLQADEKDFCR